MKEKFSLLENYSFKSKLFIRRALIASIGIFFLTGILIINLYYLQIVQFENYRTLSNNNYIKFIPIAPSRGIIYDCNGIPLAINQTTYQLEIIPKKIENLSKTINTLRTVIDITDNDIEKFKKNIKYSNHFSPIPIKTELTDIQQAQFAINQYRFPNVKITGYKYRYYPYGSTLTHVIGYVSKINENDKKKLTKEGILSNYSATKNIGKLGIERYYENILHGKTGYKKVEINNHHQVIRQLDEIPPQSGKNITLTLDLNLQQYIEKLLSGNRSAVVVIDPRDGSIRALVSHPSYDPNLFVNGINNKNYHLLLQDKNHPLVNRAIQGIYPPASTVKPYILVSALTVGIIKEDFSLFDPGWWKLPGSEKRYRDWKRFGHGYLNITKAIEESSDTFFYQLAYEMGIDKLSEWMIKFGYGKFTGIDLLEERAGIMPNRNWKIGHFKKPWYQGDTIPIGIGQGYWTATPIQMSKALITLINDGSIYIPHLLHSIWKDNYQLFYHQIKNKKIITTNSKYWKIVKEGMYGVAHHSNGTACKNFSTAAYGIAAKSGTAQIFKLKYKETYDVSKIDEHLRDHKMMIAFAPYNHPTVGIVVILENGGINQTVGNITRKILDYIFLHSNCKIYNSMFNKKD